jgi:outer membrane murein-binding lipoprotein Lpp
MRSGRTVALLAALLLAGCAATGPGPAADACSAEVSRLSALLAAETTERQRMARAAARREDELRRQLEAMKGIERGILEREDRMRTDKAR